MNTDLEEYRRRVVAQLKEDAVFIRDRASELLDRDVKQVWVHGSVLDPKRFSEDSDIDVLMVVDEPTQGLWEQLAGKIFVGDAGAIDVGVSSKPLIGKKLRIYPSNLKAKLLR